MLSSLFFILLLLLLLKQRIIQEKGWIIQDCSISAFSFMHSLILLLLYKISIDTKVIHLYNKISQAIVISILPYENSNSNEYQTILTCLHFPFDGRMDKPTLDIAEL